ncbi:hypothetical protein FOA43_002685 [Brettanomyces nanus]|uniref:EamA domain-containing protein n=1 Tax=Eeniella nana TaxID=13502 RepID=A0A875S5M4_EENNA|nr:uncharacterized protein FOA43_002685 [Brettanomyces nanus]QPG75332.1 hypothetical protein FOA43_002685 [Brettanomyces nanus]
MNSPPRSPISISSAETYIPEALRLRSPVVRLRTSLIHDPVINQSYVKSPIIRERTASLQEHQVLDQVLDIIKTDEHTRWIKGLFYLAVLIITWVIAVQLANNLMKNTDYDHPLFIAAVDGVFFLLFGIRSLLRHIYSALTRTFGYRSPLIRQPVINYQAAQSEPDSILLEALSYQLSYYEILSVGAQVAIVYFISGACATTALKYTSASNQTILSTTSSLFTLMLGVLTHVERFSVAKLVAIVVSIIGICLITMEDSIKLKYSTSNLEILGDLIALAGALAYSAFLIILRLKLGGQTDSQRDILVYVCLGICTILFVTPLLGIADLIGLEKFSFPPDRTTLLIILLCGFLNAVSDYCASVASLLTSPLITSLSLSMAIPVSMLCDSFFFHTIHTSATYYLGIILIFSSFIFTSLSDQEDVINTAVKEAVSEAVNYNDALSPILTPHLSITSPFSSPALLTYDEIPGFNIDNSSNIAVSQQQLVVAGGHNRKYFIREVKT